MRIAIASAKGGVSKTTSAMFLAAAATLRGEEAVVLDADPQSSASEWMDLAAASGDGLGFEVVPANLSTLSRPSKAGRWEFVDCPPAGRLLDAGTRTADFVVVPSADSASDLRQAWATIEALTVPAALLLARVEPRTRAYAATIEAVESQETPRFDAVVLKRQAIKNSFGGGISDLYEYGQVLAELRSVLMEKGEGR